MTRIDSRIDDWKRKLIDLTRRNRLLFFLPARRSSLCVTEPSPSDVFQWLVVKERPWKFFIPPEENDGAERPERSSPPLIRLTGEDGPSPEIPKRRPDELLCTTREARTIRGILRTLHRRSRSDLAERGVHILYVTFGILEWQEAQVVQPTRSPLVMVPVEILRKSANDPFELSAAEEDIIVNPALRVKLQNDFRIELPLSPDDWEENSLDNYLAQVTEWARLQRWGVSRDCWIGLFSFHKLVIYEDLNSHTEIIKRHPIVQALSGEREVRDIFTGELPDPRQLDTSINSKDSYLVADADSSQLACIEAGKGGVNLVIHGPPGTGKSQTITNLIAEAIAAGRTVLFMSEKMAALEVVYKRLHDANLGHYCLELHSQKANKREIVRELYRCLQESLQPQSVMTEQEFERLANRRHQLNTRQL